jgi:hypothetical protein
VGRNAFARGSLDILCLALLALALAVGVLGTRAELIAQARPVDRVAVVALAGMALRGAAGAALPHGAPGVVAGDPAQL